MIITVGADNILHATSFDSALDERTTYFYIYIKQKRVVG